MHISVDDGKCIASGACVLACPEVFDQDDEGVVVLLDETPAAALHDRVRMAVMDCPAAVISVDSPGHV